MFDCARRVVVKVGSSTVAPGGRGLDQSRMDALATQVAREWSQGRQVVLVSSGAVAAGRSLLALKGPPRTVPLKQACAATGQRALLAHWERAFAPHGLRTAQILLTGDVTRNRTRFTNSRNTFETLLRFGVVPVINENDTVAVDEIRFGDNDQLAVLVANLIHAQVLVLLTDTEGLYTADPQKDPTAQRIAHVARVDEQVLALAGDSVGGGVGSGGMRSKVQTAASAAAFGVTTVVAHGAGENVLNRLLAGEDLGTTFAAEGTPLTSRKHWIAFSTEPRGTLVLDSGAVQALSRRGSSLLPSGIVAVSGDFGPGDTVRCIGPDGVEVARGLTNYGVHMLVRICGLRSEELHALLGDDACEEAIHRDDLVLSDGLRQNGAPVEPKECRGDNEQDDE